MGFLDPKKQQEDDVLPGSGLRLDLDVRVCPTCRRESLPWQERCAECGVATVAPTELPAERFSLPHLEDDDEDDDAGPEGGTDGGGGADGRD